mgnify:CR=1 FL=1
MTVEIRCDPAFVEEAVFLELGRVTAAGVRQMASAFHRERETVYELPDTQQRDAAFQRLAHRYFETLGLSELFTARLEEFPRLSDRIELILLHRVWLRKEEQVELYVDQSREVPLALTASTTLFIGLQASRCLEREALTAWLRHELMHVSDMLDPTFAYDPHPAFGGECEPEHERIRARFRALWDLWVHVRLRRMGWQTVTADAVRRQEVERMFACLDPTHREELFKTVSEQDRWTQGELLALARQPDVAITT